MFIRWHTSIHSSLAAVHQLIKQRLRVLQKVTRWRQLSNMTLLHDEDAVRVQNSVDAVSNGEHCAGGKLLADGCLNKSVCLLVHTGSGFINAQHLGKACLCLL